MKSFLWAFLVSLATSLQMSHPVHLVSAKSHPQDIVASMLYLTYGDVYHLQDPPMPLSVINPQSLFLHLSSRSGCVDQSQFEYFLDTVRLTQRDYPASDCQINTSTRHLRVLHPYSNFHFSLHQSKGQVHDELLEKCQLYIEQLPIPNIETYNFSVVDDKFECLAHHQELMQIVYHETFLEIALKVVAQVPDDCSFANVNRNFNQQYISEVKVELPVNGTFRCQSGTSPTCRASTALTRRPRYKHFD